MFIIYFCSSFDYFYLLLFFVIFVWGRCVLFCCLFFYCYFNCGFEFVVFCFEVYGVWCWRWWFYVCGVVRMVCVLCCLRLRFIVVVLWCLFCWIGIGCDEICVFVCFLLLSLLFVSLLIVCEWFWFGFVDMLLEICCLIFGFGIFVDLIWWSVFGGWILLGFNWLMSGFEKFGMIFVGSVYLDMWSGDEFGGCWFFYFWIRFLISNVVVVWGLLV